MPKLGAQRLQMTLEAVTRLEHGGGPRERAALGLMLDEWLPYGDPIPARFGEDSPPAGFALGDVAGTQVWLIPGGRVLAQPDDPLAPTVITPFSDVALDPERVCPPLRLAALTSYVGGVPLSELPGSVVAPVVADLLTQVWDLDSAGRALVMRSLAESMRPGDGWDASAVRIKSGFERGLGDRMAPVRTVSAVALVRIGAGQGPQLPHVDIGKMLMVLLAVPYTDVHVAALQALNDLPDEVLAPMAPSLEPVLQGAVADGDPDTRRLASALEVRFAGRSDVQDLSARLASTNSSERIAALELLARDSGRDIAILLPRVLDALGDPDPAVRASAADLLIPLLDREPERIRQRIVTTLLESTDPRLVQAGVDYLANHPTADPDVLRATRVALDGPEENRAAVAALLVELYDLADVDRAAEGYGELLRHKDPVVRQATLRGLAASPPRRQTVKEDLFAVLQEHLRDPEPVLRVEAARAMIGLGYPHAVELAGQLLLDPEPVTRRGVLAVLRPITSPDGQRRAEQLAQQVDTLLALPADGDGDGRVRWTGALTAVSAERSPRVNELLAAVVCEIPADTSDPFLRQAIEEIDARLLERTAGGEDLLSLLRHMMEPPFPQPEHACRLAGAVAAQSPSALDFLWTLYTAASGAAAEAARRELAALAAKPKSAAVVNELDQLMDLTDDPARRDVLRAIQSSDIRQGGA